MESCSGIQLVRQQRWTAIRASENLPANDKAARLSLPRNFADSLHHPDVTGDGVFEREFDLIGEDDRHRSFLLHLGQAFFATLQAADCARWSRATAPSGNAEPGFSRARVDHGRSIGAAPCRD